MIADNEAILKEVKAVLAEGSCTLSYDGKEYTLSSKPRYYVQELDICTFSLNWRVWDRFKQKSIARFECEREAQLMADRYNNAKRDTNIETDSRDPRSCPEADHRKDVQ